MRFASILAAIVLAVSLFLIPAAFASFEIGGAIGVSIAVSENASDEVIVDVGDNPDSPGYTSRYDENPDIESKIYYRSYSSFNGETIREENYAFFGEEVVYEIFATEPDYAAEVMLDIGVPVICERKTPKTAHGTYIGELFSENIIFNADDMAYFECKYTVQDEEYGTARIIVLDENFKTIGSKRESFVLNPSLMISFSAGEKSSRMINLIDFFVEAKGCSSSALVEPYKDKAISLAACNPGEFIIGRIG